MIKVLLLILVIVIVYITGFCMGCSWIFKRNYEFTQKQCKRGDKFWRMLKVLNVWLDINEDGKKITDYFYLMNYKNVAVYGIGYLGKHLVKELKASDIKIDYIIDKNVKETKDNIAIYTPEDVLPDTSVIIVTAIMEFDEIADMLEDKIKCPIISVEDIIFEV